MLQAKFSNRTYRKNDDKGKRFIFYVSGTPEELEQYKAAQGANLRVDDAGHIMYFVTEFLVIPGQPKRRQIIQKTYKLGIKFDGSGVFVDDNDQTMKLNELLADQNELAKVIRMKMAEEYLNGSSAAASEPAAKKEKPVVVEDDPNKVLNDLKVGVEGSPEVKTPVINEPDPAIGTVSTL